MSATRLAEELHETNRLLREYVKPEPEPEGYRSDLMPVAGFAFLAAFRAMRTSLVDVPGSYFKREEESRRVTIACKCRKALDLPLYAFHECGCGRVFCVTHRSVKVLPLDG